MHGVLLKLLGCFSQKQKKRHEVRAIGLYGMGCGDGNVVISVNQVCDGVLLGVGSAR